MHRDTMITEIQRLTDYEEEKVPGETAEDARSSDLRALESMTDTALSQELQEMQDEGRQ